MKTMEKAPNFTQMPVCNKLDFAIGQIAIGTAEKIKPCRDKRPF